MQSLLRSNRAVVLLSLNAIALLLILLAVFSREGRSVAQVPPASIPALAPGSALTVMPAQLSPNTWGCYVMDTQNQTLSVYQFSPGEHQLRFAAARDIQYDRKVGDYNTLPSPVEIRKMQERAAEPLRAAPTTEKSPEGAGQ